MKRLLLLSLACAATATFRPASAQSACVTANCIYGDAPLVCRLRAAPRTPTVLMGNGLSQVFVPPNPKIEPGDCIVWLTASQAHNSSGSSCPDLLACSTPSPAACEFETGNLDPLSDSPSSTCYYDPVAFPAETADNFYCRIHASPTVGTMRGTMRITTPVVLTVGKDLGAGSVKLSWTGGGVAGDVSYKVARQSGGDPTFPAASTSTVNPDGGVLGTTFTDPGELGSPTSRYYLVRNKQTNEP